MDLPVKELQAQREPQPHLGSTSFHTRLLVPFVGLVLLTGMTVVLISVASAARATRRLADEMFREASAHAVTRTKSFVLGKAPLLESLARLGPDALAVHDSDRLAGQLLGILQANPGLTWLSYGDESGAFTGAYRTADGRLRINQSRILGDRTHLVEHEIESDGSREVVNVDPDSGYDPRTRPFYQRAKQEKRLVWMPPYVFFGQDIPGITAAAPMYDAHGRLTGVMTADFDLNILSDFAGDIKISRHAVMFIFTTEGTLLAHPKTRVVHTDAGNPEQHLLTLEDAGDPLVDAFRKHLPQTFRQPTGGERFETFTLQHNFDEHFASATAFEVDSGLTWIVGAIAPASDFLGDVQKGQITALSVAAIAVVVAVGLSTFLAYHVSKPVYRLTEFVKRVGEGDLDARAKIRGSREFRELSATLNAMVDALRDRLRLRYAMSLATEVQQRLLPSAPPEMPALDIAGHSTYCDETGGDYYDFMLLDEQNRDRIMLAMGDVMGHGIASALVMSGVRAVLRDRSGDSRDLAQLMTRLNSLMESDLRGSHFMTMHLSIVDTRTSMFRWCSAGHDPAILYDPAKEQFEETAHGDPPLGIMAGVEFHEHSHGPLRTGQIIFIGTDGVWECRNSHREFYGKDRLRAFLRRCAACNAAEIVSRLVDELDDFRAGADRKDDCTFIVVKVR